MNEVNIVGTREKLISLINCTTLVYFVNRTTEMKKDVFKSKYIVTTDWYYTCSS